MKKGILFEVDITDDGKHCGRECQFLSVNDSKQNHNYATWFCSLFCTELNRITFEKGSISNEPGRTKECMKKAVREVK